LELKCRKVAQEHPVDFDHVLFANASEDYINVCKDPVAQKIIKDKILDKEDYRYIIVPTYGPGEPYRPRGEGPFGHPDLIGVL
jgi:hypothetical protein